MTYRPLPEGLEVRPSSIHGFGLFTTRLLPADTLLGISHIKHPAFPDGYARTPLGGFYNHSDTPNCRLGTSKLEATDTIVKVLQTIKPIPSGEELTCTYTLYSLSNA